MKEDKQNILDLLLPALQAYRRKNGLKEAIEVFRIETSIYVVRV